jgi:hypothetical protein
VAKVLWTQKQDIGPRPRVAHAMVFDVTRQRVVLFGGNSLAAGAMFGDTWEWDADSWTQVQDIGPSARGFHAMAYDSVRRRVVLFGGQIAGAGPVGDTWEWDGENWTQVADSGPSARSRHAMTFDSARQRVVLFGGESAAGRLNDTWEWDGDEWVQQADSGPAPRINPAMAYDSLRNRVVLFGGATATVGLGDTWEWDGEAWTEEADFGPDACLGAAMVFNTNRIALFGGSSSIDENPANWAIFSRSWEWDGRHWTARQDMGPGPRVFHAMAFDRNRSRVVLFGGSPVPINAEGAAASTRGDTWEQFESGAATAPAGDLASIVAVPNPVTVGGVVEVTVTLTHEAAAVESILITLNEQEVTNVNVNPGDTSATTQFALDPNLPPGQATLTARLANSEISTTLMITAAVEVQIVSLTADPNPVTGGETVTFTVTLAAPAPSNTTVPLEVENQVVATIPIAAGATTGALQIQTGAGQPATVTITARSGQSQASVDLTIQ